MLTHFAKCLLTYSVVGAVFNLANQISLTQRHRGHDDPQKVVNGRSVSVLPCRCGLACFRGAD